MSPAKPITARPSAELTAWETFFVPAYPLRVSHRHHPLANGVLVDWPTGSHGPLFVAIGDPDRPYAVPQEWRRVEPGQQLRLERREVDDLGRLWIRAQAAKQPCRISY